MQKVSQRGLAEIAAHEGIVNYPYFDSQGIRTVGIGHTAAAGDPDPAKNLREFSVAEIMDIFARDIAKFEARVRKAFTRPLTQEQFDAAVSFDFNTGAIHRATWVKKFNAGDVAGARKSMMDWRKPKEIIPRRQKERDLFFDGRYSSDGFATLYPANLAGNVLWSRGQRVNVLSLMDEGSPPSPSKPAPSGGISTDGGVDITIRDNRIETEAKKAAKPPKAGIAAAIVAMLLAAGAFIANLPCQWLGVFCGG